MMIVVIKYVISSRMERPYKNLQGKIVMHKSASNLNSKCSYYMKVSLYLSIGCFSKDEANFIFFSGNFQNNSTEKFSAPLIFSRFVENFQIGPFQVVCRTPD